MGVMSAAVGRSEMSVKAASMGTSRASDVRPRRPITISDTFALARDSSMSSMACRTTLVLSAPHSPRFVVITT